jgi:hypothetical protein
MRVHVSEMVGIYISILLTKLASSLHRDVYINGARNLTEKTNILFMQLYVYVHFPGSQYRERMQPHLGQSMMK